MSSLLRNISFFAQFAAKEASGAIRMTPIQDLLHRIQWDPQFGHGDFVVGYYDRVRDSIVRVPFQRLSLATGNHFSFDVIAADGSVRMVPLHRVREVWRDGQLIWQRAVE
jgi:uncharacterized protein (UPF0248 family)